MSNAPPRILVVSEIPTPYRLPLYARLAEQPEIDLEIVFCAADEPDRPWQITSELEGVPHRVLKGIALARRNDRNTFVYQVNPGIVRELMRTRYDAVVIGGYAVFAEQAAIAIARLRRIPYLLHSESTLLTPRSDWVRAAKEVVVRSVVTHAAGGLAVGSEAARYLQHYGLAANRIKIVPNTIDVEAYANAAESARRRDAELRSLLDLPERYILFAGRLVEAKGVRDLLAALQLLGQDAPLLVIAGEGPLGAEISSAPNVRRLGFVQRERLIELFALAEWTVVPSRFEPWGVVVNEALACGCPVIVSDVVGAGSDLVDDAVNGRVVRANDPGALADALRSPVPRIEPGEGKIAGWNYDFAVEQFVDAIRLVLPGRVGPRTAA